MPARPRDGAVRPPRCPRARPCLRPSSDGKSPRPRDDKCPSSFLTMECWKRRTVCAGASARRRSPSVAFPGGMRMQATSDRAQSRRSRVCATARLLWIGANEENRLRREATARHGGSGAERWRAACRRRHARGVTTRSGGSPALSRHRRGCGALFQSAALMHTGGATRVARRSARVHEGRVPLSLGASAWRDPAGVRSTLRGVADVRTRRRNRRRA